MPLLPASWDDDNVKILDNLRNILDKIKYAMALRQRKPICGHPIHRHKKTEGQLPIYKSFQTNKFKTYNVETLTTSSVQDTLFQGPRLSGTLQSKVSSMQVRECDVPGPRSRWVLTASPGPSSSSVSDSSYSWSVYLTSPPSPSLPSLPSPDRPGGQQGYNHAHWFYLGVGARVWYIKSENFKEIKFIISSQ